jgi:tellurite resistance protein TerC
MPVTADYHQSKFFVKVDGRRFATPLAIVLLVIETTDLVFALDSIPAIFGVTHDSFIVYTSNVFAILGLRSLYFALAGLMGLFHYLKIGLSAVLVFIGIKMLLPIFHIEIPIQIALGVIAGILSVSVIASIVRLRKGDIK